MNKSEKTRQAILITREKRKNQTCKVFEVKIDKSKLSDSKITKMFSLFREAKWLYNHCLAQDDIFLINKVNTVLVMNKDKELEERPIENLSSQMKQSIIEKCKQNIINLSKAKKKGISVGRLKFKSEYNSIPLKQFGVTYKIIGCKHIKIQGIKGKIRVNGLEQIQESFDIACGNLIKRNNEFYLYITTFSNKENKQIPSNGIGIDFGIATDFTFSNGIKLNTNFDTSKLKRDQQRLSKKKKGSKNHYKQRNKLRKQYERLDNQKRDVKNKLVSYLKSNFNHIAIQDENIKGWHSSLFGKQVQDSILGITLSELKKHDKTFIVDRFVPTTKACYICGQIQNILLSERLFVCDCGLVEDRDVKSAKAILLSSKLFIPTEYRDLKPVEKKTTVDMFNYLNTFISHASVNQEANVFKHW